MGILYISGVYVVTWTWTGYNLTNISKYLILLDLFSLNYNYDFELQSTKHYLSVIGLHTTNDLIIKYMLETVILEVKLHIDTWI